MITVSFAGQTYPLPSLAGENGWANLTAFLVALASNAATQTALKQAVRVAATSPVTLAVTDCTVVTNLTAPGAVAVTLPTGVTKQILVIVDGKGDAASNPITITPTAGTINGAPSYVINVARGGVTLQYDGTEWKVVSAFYGESPSFSNLTITSLRITGLGAGVLHGDGSGNVTSSALVNADIASGAAIAHSKLAALTVSRALQTDSNGVIEASAVTATELGRLSGVTAAIQTQIDGKQAADVDLTAVAALVSTGLIVRTGLGAAATRTLTAGSNKVTVSNGDGVAGNPTVDVNEANFAFSNTSNVLLAGGNSRGVALAVGAIDAQQLLLKANNVDKLLIDTIVSSAIFGDFRATASFAGWKIPVGTTAQRPSSPSNGLIRYNTDTAAFEGYGTAWSPLGGGSSSGVNVVPTAAQNGSSGWGSSSATISTDSSSSNNPLAGITASTMSVLSSMSGGYAHLRWTMPAGLQNQPVNIAFWSKLAATSDFRVELYYNAASNYGGTYTRVVLNSDVASVTNLNAGSTLFKTFFVEQGQSYYELRIVRTAASAATCYLTQIGVGILSQLGNGFAGSDWQSYAPTLAGIGSATFTAAQTAFFWRRVGDSLELSIKLAVAVAGSGATEVNLPLPTGLAIDTAKQSTSGSQDFGRAVTLPSALASTYQIIDATSTSLRFYDAEGTWSGLTGEGLTAGLTLWAKAVVPIANWSSNVTLADRAMEEYASNSSTADGANTTSFAYGPNGSPIAAMTSTSDKRVRFQSSILPTDRLSVEINFGGTDQWIPLESSIIGGQNSATQGITIYRTSGSTTDCDVRFGSAGHAATPASNASAWTSRTTTLWRVRKVSGGASVGFPISTRNLVGDMSGTAIPAGLPGEVVTSFPANVSQASPVLNTNYTIGTLSIPSAGQWLVKFFTAQNLNATGVSQFAEVNLASSGGTTVYATPCVLSPGQATGDAFVGGCAEMLVRTTGAVTITATMRHSNFKTGSPGTPTSIGAYANQFIGTRTA